MPDHMVRLSCSWALLQITNRLSNCSAEHRHALVSSGHQKLDQRASGCLTSVEKPRRFQLCSVLRSAWYLNTIKYTFSPDPGLAPFNKSTTPRKPERLANSGVILARPIHRTEVASINPSPSR